MAAHIEDSNRITFYENGIMSVNIPIATQVVGARASRTTHPLTLSLLEQLLSLVRGRPVAVENPYMWMTKVEVVAELASSQHARLITLSLSCSRTRFSNRAFGPHCGRCIQCLQRRISTLCAGVGDSDERAGYQADVFRDPMPEGRDRVLAVGSIALAMTCADLSDRQFLGEFADAVSRCLTAIPSGQREEAVRRLADLFRRHGQAVRDRIIEEEQRYVPDVVKGTAAPDSLLSVVLKGGLGAAAPERTGWAQEAPLRDVHKPTGLEGRIFVAFNEQRRCIMISDRPELKGRTIVSLMQFLINAWKEDRANELAPENHRSFAAKILANELALKSDEAARSAVKDARKTLAETDWMEASGASDANAVIETTGDGYRLNPNVIVVSASEFRSATLTGGC